MKYYLLPIFYIVLFFVIPTPCFAGLQFDGCPIQGGLLLGHGHGLASSFLHLSKVLVKEGVQVSQGEPIARVGAIG